MPPPPAANAVAPGTAAAAGRPVSSVVAAMSRASGAIILADSSVAGQNVPTPSEATTATNFETQLDAVVKALPAGATWARVYLPVTGSVSRLSPDAVTDYLMAQAHLFGTVGAATPAGTVEIMGQKVTQDKATPVIAALNLKPVYIVTNPRLRANPTAEAGAGASNWGQMSPEQRRAYAQQQAQQLLSMDPAQQQQYMQQQREVMRSMMQQMTPEQRQQFFQNMGGGGPGGGGGWGRRNRGGGGGGGQQ